MLNAPHPTVEVHLSAETWRATQVDAALRSLADDPPWLDPVWFYDRRGSELFDTITRLDEYYPTRVETSLLEEHAATIASIGADTLVELGSGTSAKTTLLLDAMNASGMLRRYVPLDVSEATLRVAAAEVAGRYPEAEVHGVVGDFNRHLASTRLGERRLVAFLGSTIGNLGPAARRRLLSDLDSTMDRQDRLLLGIDLVKDRDRIVAAYDDAEGVTAEFNRNALLVLNREVGSDFDPEGFDHVALWNEDELWVEMWLRAAGPQVVDVPGLGEPLVFEEGDALRTETSAKFTLEGMTSELWESGLVVEEAFTDGDGDYALLMARPFC